MRVKTTNLLSIFIVYIYLIYLLHNPYFLDIAHFRLLIEPRKFE
jgi:hypothetical protein